MSVSLRRKIYKFHLTAAIAVGLQLLVWTGSGLFMSAVPIEVVHGDHTRATHTPTHIDLTGLSVPEGKVAALQLIEIGGKPAWVSKNHEGAEQALDAKTGATIVIDAAFIERQARASLTEPSASLSIRLIKDEAPIEYRGELPVWQVIAADATNTHLYFSPVTAEERARRTGTWRVYDFLWSLHIMDYKGRENFNHPLIILFAASALAFSISGAGLLWFRYRPKGTATK